MSVFSEMISRRAYSVYRGSVENSYVNALILFIRVKAIGDCMTDLREQQLSADSDETRASADILRQELNREISRLNRFSTRGILALSLFIAVSMLAWWEFSFLPAPEIV